MYTPLCSRRLRDYETEKTMKRFDLESAGMLVFVVALVGFVGALGYTVLLSVGLL